MKRPSSSRRLLIPLIGCGVLLFPVLSPLAHAEAPKDKPVLWDKNETTLPMPNADGKATEAAPVGNAPSGTTESKSGESKSEEMDLREEMKTLKERVSKIEKKLALEILDEQKKK